MGVINHRDVRAATAAPEGHPGCDRGQKALVVMGMNDIDREAPQHPDQFDDQQRVQHEKLAPGGSRPEMPVAGQLWRPMNTQGATGRSRAEMVGDDVDLVPDLGECLGHPKDPNGRPSRIRKRARCDHGDIEDAWHR